jgi:hypothetical protein
VSQNFRLYQNGGDTYDIDVLTVRGWRTLSKNLRLTQSPGGSQSFVLGRNVARASPIALRLLVGHISESHARTELAGIVSFARDAVMLGRLDSNGVVDVDSLERLLDGNALHRVSPEPLHLGADAWSVLLELRPAYPVLTTQANTRVTTGAVTRVTSDGKTRVTFNAV